VALYLRPIDVSANEKMRAPDVVSEPDAPRPATGRAYDARSSRGCDGVTATRRPAGRSPQENRVAARVISGAQQVALGAWNALVGDDLRIVADAHASAVRRTIAGIDLALAMVPEGKVLELGAKLAAGAAGRAAESTTAHVAASASTTRRRPSRRLAETKNNFDRVPADRSSTNSP